MTTIEAHATSVAHTGAPMARVADWVTSTDHKKIGRLYLATSAVAMLGALVVAALVGKGIAGLHCQRWLLALPIFEFIAPQFIESQCPETLPTLIPDHAMCRKKRRAPDRPVRVGNVEQDQPVALCIR